jgi:hypothetical protein
MGVEVEEMMSQKDDSWNPHARLEFLKVAIQLDLVSKIRKNINNKN